MRVPACATHFHAALWAPAPAAPRAALAHCAGLSGAARAEASSQGFAAAAAAAAPAAAPLVLGGCRVVLVAPKTAANVGAVLRAAQNFEAHDVWLVDPRFDPWADPAVGQVSHGSAVAASMVVAPTLQAALADTRGSIGFTRRAGAGRLVHASLRRLGALFPAALPAIATTTAPAAAGAPLPPPAERPVALVFGREESGLLESELLLCAHACAIPTGRSQPSLNLSHAVAVVLSQLFEAAVEAGLGGPDAFDSERVRLQRSQALEEASHAEVEALLERATALLAAAGISTEDSVGGGDRSNHGRKRRPVGHLRALLRRSQASTAEVRALHGLCKDLAAALPAAAGEGSEPG